MEKSKQGNSGFTLIELLIAMVIIAIVLTPLYGNFRQSTYLNGKAKLAMDATNMASNIMEGLSAYSAEEIILGFYTYDSVSNNNPNRLSTLNIMPNEVTVAGYGDLEATGGGYSKHFATETLSPDASVDYSNALYANAIGGTTAPAPLAKYLQIDPSGSVGGRYYFYAEGVTQARGTYDIMLVLDTSASTGFSGDTDGNGIINGTEIEGYNDYESALISNINPLFDGVYTETTNQRANAAATFISRKTNSALNITEQDLYPYLRRAIIIDIAKTPGATGNQATITVEELYSITMANFNTSSGSYVDWSSDFSGASMTYSLPPVTVFDSATYGTTPRDIYIYYTGNYNSTSTRPLDYFTIKNPDKIPVNIHLMRIKSTETNDTTEATYYATVDVQEDKGSGYATDIYSNLRDDLTKTGAENASNRADSSRSKAQIKGAVPTADDYDEVYHETGGVRTERRDRLYAVTMYVYEEGAAAAGFPAELLITEFNGNSMQ